MRKSPENNKQMLPTGFLVTVGVVAVVWWVIVQVFGL